MKTVLFTAAALLTGCAGMAPLTPQEAAAIMYMQRTYQAPQTVYQPVYVRPQQTQAPVWTAPAPRPQINCVTTSGGYSLYTSCR